MANATINIPLSTLNNSTWTGQAAVHGGLSQVEVLVNRNVGALPMNNDPSVILALDLQLSWDGGATFASQGATFSIPGGTILAEDGTVEATSFLIISNLAPNPTHAKAVVTATGQFSVSGTVTLS